MADTIHVRTEGGSVMAMDLPLPEGIAQRFGAGLIARVNPDGSDFHESEPAPTAPKAPAKPKRASATKPTTENEEG